MCSISATLNILRACNKSLVCVCHALSSCQTHSQLQLHAAKEKMKLLSKVEHAGRHHITCRAVHSDQLVQAAAQCSTHRCRQIRRIHEGVAADLLQVCVCLQRKTMMTELVYVLRDRCPVKILLSYLSRFRFWVKLLKFSRTKI